MHPLLRVIYMVMYTSIIIRFQCSCWVAFPTSYFISGSFIGMVDFRKLGSLTNVFVV